MSGNKQSISTRQIHIRISDETHRRMRMRVAELDTRIQDWVESLIVDALKSRRGRGDTKK